VGSAVSTSAMVSRVCGFLALGSSLLFWIFLSEAWHSHLARGGDPDGIMFMVVIEGVVMAGLSLLAIICAVVGLTHRHSYPGNAKALRLAILLIVLGISAYLAPINIYLSSDSFPMR